MSKVNHHWPGTKRSVGLKTFTALNGPRTPVWALWVENFVEISKRFRRKVPGRKHLTVWGHGRRTDWGSGPFTKTRFVGMRRQSARNTSEQRHRAARLIGLRPAVDQSAGLSKELTRRVGKKGMGEKTVEKTRTYNDNSWSLSEQATPPHSPILICLFS